MSILLKTHQKPLVAHLAKYKELYSYLFLKIKYIFANLFSYFTQMLQPWFLFTRDLLVPYVWKSIYLNLLALFGCTAFMGSFHVICPEQKTCISVTQNLLFLEVHIYNHIWSLRHPRQPHRDCHLLGASHRKLVAFWVIS